MKVQNNILHAARLKNNCPECFANDGLEITFSQEEKETKFYKKATSKITEQLYCHTCKHIIYPVNWDNHIELVYDYNKKLVVPKKTNYQFKGISYGIAIAVIIVISILLFFLNNLRF